MSKAGDWQVVIKKDGGDYVISMMWKKDSSSEYVEKDSYRCGAGRISFTYENGTEVPDTKGAYLTFTLHFMAEKDMIVHLNSADSSDGAGDGTNISSSNAELPEAMRISFTADGQTWIYDQGMGDTLSTSGTATTFGLPSMGSTRINSNNAMFSLKKNTDKPVLVHIWMEGTDPACTDSLKSADYAIRMRFTGETTETINTREK